ncbi:MAG: class I SAM-dependent methyltransferase [Caldilineales bacterium]|nr:class I SAM-dependent methyltransferase [Caldilineales bacterium]MDW8316882.1 class I SAM-dependent methyltransferase [Anaerolineae bacterium]
MLDPTQRFSSRAQDYVRYRPGYPPALLDLLKEHCRLTPQTVVADVGSGTGLLTKLFLDYGCRVFAVEPNREMREAAEALVGGHPNFVSVAGRAEATGLPAASVDLVTAGQAFHWFEPEAAVAEFRRILAAPGGVALVWNERLVDATPFLAAYEALLQTYGTDYRAVDHRRVGRADLVRWFGAGPLHIALDNRQDLDLAAAQGRLLSSSYVPLAGQPGHEAMLAAFREIFAAHQVGGRVAFLYTTQVYLWAFDGERFTAPPSAGLS